ncbi:HAD family hydrolase [Oceanobacillus kapialis]|uniref:HAD family hydrolase n=1 Tax=Oceanobacillus kapialis TaxID=481353 RepID=UPI0038508A6C
MESITTKGRYHLLTNIKAILFDKDGTLMNFHSVWEKVMQELIEQLSGYFPQREVIAKQLSEAIGFKANQVDANGILAGGTTKDIAEAFEAVIKDLGLQHVFPFPIFTWISETMLELTKKHIDEVTATTESLTELLAKLGKQGIILGVATADDYPNTELCLEKLNIRNYFSFIATSDRFPQKKPDPFILEVFCSAHQLRPEEVAVIGDTSVDLNLARNGKAGLAIGVLSGASELHHLQPLADFVIPTVADILTVDNQWIWAESNIAN